MMALVQLQSRYLAVAGLALCAAANPSLAAPPATIVLRSQSVQLPTSDAMFPGGRQAEAINNNCLACHSTEMVLTQPKLTRPQWQAEVDKMRSVYKAPIEIADIPAIVDYLATNPGLR